ILRQALRIGLLGIIFGAVAAYPAAHVLAGLLFGVRLHDPAVYCGVAASLLFVVVAASYFPARRATRVDPLVPLPHEGLRLIRLSIVQLGRSTRAARHRCRSTLASAG